ncbi:hypothetical protein ACE1BM_23995, partial [Aeromonas jandaei]
KADFGVNTSEFWSNENFKREQAGYDELVRTFLSRLTLDKGIFTISSRSEPIYWESESDFPEEPLFPK